MLTSIDFKFIFNNIAHLLASLIDKRLFSTAINILQKADGPVELSSCCSCSVFS